MGELGCLQHRRLDRDGRELCDDAAKFNEGVTYFESGGGNGSIINAVYYLHTSTLGQWQESGRDQEHAQLGIGLLGSACQVAWNQGVDLFGYNNNRLLAGAEYAAQTNLSQSVPYKYYTNSAAANQDWISINGMGRLDDRPVWELIYNHYAVLEGLSVPNSQAMAQLMRPEHGSTDHFGYGSLTFTLNATASPYPPLAIGPAPTGLVALAGSSQVELPLEPLRDECGPGLSGTALHHQWRPVHEHRLVDGQHLPALYGYDGHQWDDLLLRDRGDQPIGHERQFPAGECHAGRRRFAAERLDEPGRRHGGRERKRHLCQRKEWLVPGKWHGRGARRHFRCGL
ncbi:MAG: hypothetical protein QM796_22315 [Chthoniobacteraceae bacterium]